ncbi:MAG: hypothetical protein Q4C50_06940 [Eubacteriales bacterium]|nr:hypothetical protein [Eubacteriales bacterium]
MNRRLVMVCFTFLLLLWAKTAEAADRSMPIEMNQVVKIIANYDPDISVSEDTAWRDDQKVYSLADGSGNQIAYLSSTGENAEGILYFLLMRADDSPSELYKDDCSTAIKAAADLYGGTLDVDKISDDFIKAYSSQKESKFRWTGTYHDTKIEIKKSPSASADLTVALYNSEKYSPVLREGNPDDYSASNPEIQISEISYAQYSEASGLEGKSADEELGENPDYRFYKIAIRDFEYHKEYKIDLELFLKFDLSKESQTAEYEYVIQNNPSDEYIFSDIRGYCRLEGNQAVAPLGIPVVERIAGGEVQYRERFHYQISFAFSIEDLETIDILT